MPKTTEGWLNPVRWLGFMSVVLLCGSSALAQELRGQLRDVLVQSAGEEQPAEEPGEYWLGIAITDVPDAVRAQLDLDDAQGAMISEVVPNSPAAKAGLERHDVLIAVQDKLIEDPRQVGRMVNEAEGDEIRVRFLRQGKEQTLSLQREKRPERPPAAADQQATEYGQALDTLMERIRSGKGPRGPVVARFFHPGVILPDAASLPDDMTVTIVKKGKEPATITVKQQDNAWEVTGDRLEDLPPEVRGHVERMLGRMPFQPWIYPPLAQPERPYPRRPTPVPPFQPFVPNEQLDERFDELHQEIDELRKAIEKLQQQR